MQDDYKVVYIHREKGKWIPIEEKPTEMASMSVSYTHLTLPTKA